MELDDSIELYLGKSRYLFFGTIIASLNLRSRKNRSDNDGKGQV